MSAPGRIPPDEVARWLTTRARPQTRNALRAFLLFLQSGQPVGRLTAAVADRLGIKPAAATGLLRILSQRGILRLRQGGSVGYVKVRLGAGLDADELLALLGNDMEPLRPARKCSACARPLDRRGACQGCVKIEQQGEWLGLRLDYYQARALRGLPLFHPPPPWAKRQPREYDGPGALVGAAVEVGVGDGGDDGD